MENELYVRLKGKLQEILTTVSGGSKRREYVTALEYAEAILKELGEQKAFNATNLGKSLFTEDWYRHELRQLLARAHRDGGQRQDSLDLSTSPKLFAAIDAAIVELIAEGVDGAIELIGAPHATNTTYAKFTSRLRVALAHARNVKEDSINPNLSWIELADLVAEEACKLRNLIGPPAPHDEGHPHLVKGEFQSDKYPTTPRGKVPLSVKDPMAQDLLWQYAERRRVVDEEFTEDLKTALSNAGYREHLSSYLECKVPTVAGKYLLHRGHRDLVLVDVEPVDDLKTQTGGRSHFGVDNGFGDYVAVEDVQGKVVRWFGPVKIGATAQPESEVWRTIPPHDMILFCPKCKKQHLDIGEFDTRVHRKHLCENTTDGPNTGCGHLWTPHPYATRGVRGKPDEWVEPVLPSDPAVFKNLLDLRLSSPRLIPFDSDRTTYGPHVIEAMAATVKAVREPNAYVTRIAVTPFELDVLVGLADHGISKVSAARSDTELDRISRELLTQDNRCTAYPIFVVQERVRDYGVENDDGTAVPCFLSNSGACVTQGNSPALYAAMERGEFEDEDEDDWNHTHYRERWQFVQPFLTQKAADEFREREAHNLGETRVYVESAHRNPEWRWLRDFMLG